MTWQQIKKIQSKTITESKRQQLKFKNMTVELTDLLKISKNKSRLPTIIVYTEVKKRIWRSGSSR